MSKNELFLCFFRLTSIWWTHQSLVICCSGLRHSGMTADGRLHKSAWRFDPCVMNMSESLSLSLSLSLSFSLSLSLSIYTYLSNTYSLSLSLSLSLHLFLTLAAWRTLISCTTLMLLEFPPLLNWLAWESENDWWWINYAQEHIVARSPVCRFWLYWFVLV